MAHDREVAGIRCKQVLARLSDFLDGDLTSAEIGQIEAHLAGCDWCERFGAEMGALVGGLRQQLGAAPAVGQEVSDRLTHRLDEAEVE